MSKILGILNLTPDSFSGDGIYNDVSSAVKKAAQLYSDGADIIDIGGESSSPRAVRISFDDEYSRVVPVAKELSLQKIPFGIDTVKRDIAKACLDYGACLINSVDADEELFRLGSDYSVPVVIMHCKKVEKTCGKNDYFNEIKKYIISRVEYAKDIGVDKIIIDPGFGFDKGRRMNLELLLRLSEFKSLGFQLLAGISRKGFLKEYGLTGTLIANYLALKSGADFIRVHDVQEHYSLLKIIDNLKI